MQVIESEEIKQRMTAQEELHLIDVRQPEEHTDFNIGGLLLPLGNIMSMQTEEIDDLKEKEIICYCRSGQRSMQAAMMLETMGFKNVKNLAGGMIGWEAKYGR
ncbi:MAG: rhodanese-like domain-containing protein [Bacteroidota bacterium]